jgi:hypothetical protein
MYIKWFGDNHTPDARNKELKKMQNSNDRRMCNMFKSIKILLYGKTEVQRLIDLYTEKRRVAGALKGPRIAAANATNATIANATNAATVVVTNAATVDVNSATVNVTNAATVDVNSATVNVTNAATVDVSGVMGSSTSRYANVVGETQGVFPSAMGVLQTSVYAADAVSVLKKPSKRKLSNYESRSDNSSDSDSDSDDSTAKTKPKRMLYGHFGRAFLGKFSICQKN